MSDSDLLRSPNAGVPRFSVDEGQLSEVVSLKHLYEEFRPLHASLGVDGRLQHIHRALHDHVEDVSVLPLPNDVLFSSSTSFLVVAMIVMLLLLLLTMALSLCSWRWW